jgi:acyl-coenzyme A synthetase/AMP-(fatty) acid ligase
MLAAVVVTRDGVCDKNLERELQKACAEKLGPASAPRAYLQIEQLPRSENGKILRSKVRDILASVTANSPALPS